jgi:hypothetical protein
LLDQDVHAIRHPEVDAAHRDSVDALQPVCNDIQPRYAVCRRCRASSHRFSAIPLYRLKGLTQTGEQ